MSAPAVKPVLPAPSAGGVQAAPTPNAASPLKNHSGSPNNVAISLVQDKTPEKAKEPAANNTANAVNAKPTPNGVDVNKLVSPTVPEKKLEDTNHVPAPATSSPPVVNNGSPAQNTTTPKATPEKTQPATNSSPAAVRNTTPPKTGPATTPTAPSTTTPAPGSATPEKPQPSPPKTNSAAPSAEEKEKPSSTSPGQISPKRGADKVDKVEKEKSPTTPRTKRKRETAVPSTPSASEDNSDSSRTKRTRVPVQPYQSPMPDLFPAKVKAPAKSPVEKDKDKDADKEKLVIFYKNEFLAVRNSEGSFYVCQAVQNVYKSSHKIKIRWLSQKDGEKSTDGTVYSPDFYDTTDFDCILTSLSLQRLDKGKFNLSKEETLRTENILKRALDVEKGVAEKPDLTEEHPDGLDLSLFKDEAQLKKRKSQGKMSSRSPKRARESESPEKKEEKPKVEKRKTVSTPKRTPAKKAGSPRGGRKAKAVVKTPVVEKKVKEEKPSTSSRRAERASEREKAKESPVKIPAKRKAESPAPPTPEPKAPKTTARTAASAKKAAAAAKAAAQAAIAAQQASSAAARKPPARGRRGEIIESEALAAPSRATKGRNARPSSPVDADKKENIEAVKEESGTKSAETADAPTSTPASQLSDNPSAPVVDASPAPAPTPAAADGAAEGSEQKTPSEAATPAVSSESTAASEGESSSSDATRNRGAKKPVAPSPPKKA